MSFSVIAFPRTTTATLNPVSPGSIVTVHVPPCWEVKQPKSSDPFTLSEIAESLKDAGYTIDPIKHNAVSLFTPDNGPNSPKPSKVIKSSLVARSRAMLSGCEFPARRVDKGLYRYYAGTEAKFWDTFASTSIIRHPAQSYRVIIARRWPTLDNVYEQSYPPPCYYEGGCYQHCGHGGELTRLNGRMLKIFKADTPDHILSAIARRGENGWEDELNQWAAGRCLLFPLDDHSERGEESAYAIQNIYVRKGIPLTLSAFRRSFCESIGWVESDRKAWQTENWFFNGTPTVIRSPDLDDSNRDYYITDCEKPGVECSDCGDVTDEDELTTVGDSRVCESCLRDNYTYCEGCEEWSPDEDMRTVADFSDGFERQRCENCIDHDSDIQPTPDWMRLDCEYLDMGR